MSREDFFRKSSIDRTQVSKIERGKINVTIETIEKISNAFDISVGNLMSIDSSHTPHPFVKWAGGKTQILDKIKDLLPSGFNNYYEPFVGGGALLFSLQPENAFIGDGNEELVCAYNCFNDDNILKKLEEKLSEHEKKHCEEYYYFIREQDKSLGFKDMPIYERAARMIYLNKACFNGLYRVNSKGFFNVPSGKKKVVKTYDVENFELIRNYFKNNNINVNNQDFSLTVQTVECGDFVYFDPPYDIYPDKNGFVDYGKNGFDKKEQIRLRDCFDKLSKKGVSVMLSNHNTPFINDIYSSYNIHVINAKRMINSKADGRGNVEEVIITNY